MGFITSVSHALRGINRALRTEPNVRWQWLATIVVVALGLFFKLTRGEWLMLVLACALVLILELINTALEKTLDIVKPRFDEQLGWVKDIMAGAVLLASVTAMVLGVLIFWPHLFGV